MSIVIVPMTKPSLREKLVWTLVLVAVSAFGFHYVDARNAELAGSGWGLALETKLDAYVPFVPQFVFPYLMYYPWLLLPVFVLRTRESFFRALAAFAVMQVIAQTVYVLFPAHMNRPEVTQFGLSADLVRFVYRVDQGWNVFPSLHVAHTVLVAILFFKYARPASWVPVAIGSLLISMSTVLIKQHYVIDIPAGVLLTSMCYAVVWLPFPIARSSYRGSMR